LAAIDLRAGDAVLAFELVDVLAGVGETAAEVLAHRLGLLGELGAVAHAFRRADDLVQVGHRLGVVAVPVEEFLEEVAHALMLAASGQELAEFPEGEFQRRGVGARGLDGGLVAVDGLAGDGFLLGFELGLDRHELGLLGRPLVDAHVEFGGLHLLVELVGEAHVGVADQGVHLGDLVDDVGVLAGAEVTEPFFAEPDRAVDVGSG